MGYWWLRDKGGKKLMSVHDELGKRMKEYYEQVPKTKLMRRCPVIIRIDGKAFHSFTKGFVRPFDDVLITSMQETAKYLCENIQGCVLSYQQSDEISLVLIDYQKLTSEAFFDYEVQKMCSIVASMATMEFNKRFTANYLHYFYVDEFDFNKRKKTELRKKLDMLKIYSNAIDKGAMFDARCFNIPKEEVTNYIYWRQLDATRNSIQMVGQANFSYKELHGKSCNQIQDMLMTQKGINWNDYPVYQKRGSCCVKEKYFVPCEGGNSIQSPAGCSDPYLDDEITEGVWRTRWVVDKEIPIFKGEDRNYIDKLIYVGEE